MMLYSSPASAVTIRAAISRIRKLLGPNVIQTRPYRLMTAVQADFLEVERLVSQGKFEAALSHYRGPLLAGSIAPRVIAARKQLDAAVQRAMKATM
jgi:hypothetical protein